MNSGHTNKPVINQYDTVSSSLIIGLLKSADTLGLSAKHCAERIGLEDRVMKDPTTRVTYKVLIAVLDDVYDQSNHNRNLGIELGKQLIPGSYSALGYAAASCETLGEAIKVIPQYEDVTLTTGKTTMMAAGDRVSLSWTSTRKPYSQILEEVILSSWVTLARTLTSKDSLDINVTLTGPAPDEYSLFSSLFGQNVMFNQSVASVSFPADLLSTPIIQSDPFIHNLMKEQADRIQQKLKYRSAFSYTVAQCIHGSLVKGDVGQEMISRELNVGVRTLRRRLKEESTSFQTILDTVRRDNSQQYLIDQHMSIFEIAMLLGYKDHSAFSAAFKRWFGVSPQVYRDRAESEKMASNKKLPCKGSCQDSIKGC